MAGYEYNKLVKAIADILRRPDFRAGIKIIEVSPSEFWPTLECLCDFRQAMALKGAVNGLSYAVWKKIESTYVVENPSLKPGQVIFEARKEDT